MGLQKHWRQSPDWEYKPLKIFALQTSFVGTEGANIVLRQTTENTSSPLCTESFVSLSSHTAESTFVPQGRHCRKTALLLISYR